MLIVDAQVHIWKGHKPTNPNHRQVENYSKDDLLKEMDAAGVERGGHPPAGLGSQFQRAGGGGGAAASRSARDPRQFPARSPGEPALVDGWKRWPGMLGLRFALNQPHQQTWLTDGTADWLWPAAERAGLPVALIGANVLQSIGGIAERHPGLKLIIDHFGRPDASWSHLPGVLAQARHQNVALKATGAPSYSSEPYPYRNIHGHIRKLYDAFGPDRMFWGTDITRMPVLVEAVRHDVHRGAAVAVGAGQGADHGPGPLHLARLEAAGLKDGTLSGLRR